MKTKKYYLSDGSVIHTNRGKKELVSLLKKDVKIIKIEDSDLFVPEELNRRRLKGGTK